MNTRKASKRTSQLANDPIVVAINGFLLMFTLSIFSAVTEVTPIFAWGTNGAIALLFGYQTLRIGRRYREQIENFGRKQAEELDEWQERWQRLYQETQDATSALVRMRDGVIMLGSEDQVLLINPAARRLLGLSENLDMNKRFFRESVRYPELSRAIDSAYSGAGSQKLRLLIQDGDVQTPLKIRVDHFGSMSENHLLITLRDETESHRVESMRREFVANISHELKTPLAAIKGYAETVELAIKDDPEAASHFMKQIHGQCLRLERLVADMMQLARAQAGSSLTNSTKISLTESIDESLKSLQHLAESKCISLVFNRPQEAPIVQADPEGLLAICNNLISNAVRYTPDHGNITISCHGEENYWVLTVEDDGIGINVSDQKRIFERFYRVDKRADSNDGGTGIGLSIVKNLVVTLGGEVRVSSHLGQGAKFQVCLPKSENEKVQ
ncbi:MAG: sensor histidine kinase [Rubripirellula sp.]